MEPYHTHAKSRPIEPSRIYRFGISIEPVAHRFGKGVEIVNDDSVVTHVLWTHYYAPNKIGTDLTHHPAEYPPVLVLPVMEGI